MKRIEVVAAAIVRDGRVLAARRSAEMVLPNLWEFPGGKIEPGEPAEDALTRELQEELGCTVEVGQLVIETHHQYEFGLVILSTYYAKIRFGTPAATEHSELRWCNAAELTTLEWAPADLPAVALVAASL